MKEMLKALFTNRYASRLIFLLVLPLIFKIMEVILDYIIGNNDGEFLVVKYLLFLAYCVYFIYLSSKISNSILGNLILSVCSTAFLLGLLELIFSIIINNVMEAPALKYVVKTQPINKKFTKYDKYLGYMASPNTVSTEKLYFKNKEIVEADYNIDTNGRRVSFEYFKSHNKKRYAMFMGCSFTFGFLVNDSQTVASQFASIDTNYKAYNYGLNGYGTQQLLTIFKKQPRTEVAESNGAFVYLFIDAHVKRVIGDQLLMETNPWAYEFPYYDLENDSLIYKGTFGKNRRFKNFIYHLAGRSYLLKYFHVKFPLSTDEHFELAGRLIDQSFREYKSEFNNNNYFVVIFPGQSTKIISYIQEKNIKILDYSMLYDYDDSKYHIKEDLHPSALGYEIIAKNLAKDIEELSDK